MMKPHLLLTAAMGFTLVAAQLAAAQSGGNGETTSTGAAQAPMAAPSGQAPSYATPPNVGIITLKPGETFSTSKPQDYGSVQAGATALNPGASNASGSSGAD